MSSEPAVVNVARGSSSPSHRLYRLGAWLATPTGLAVLFVAGLLIRLVLARGGGFPFDMSSFAAWAGRLAERGPLRFYPQAGEEFFVDYPPGYLYVLWGLGVVARGAGATVSVFVLKIPPVLADLGLAWVVMRLAERLAPAGLARRLPVRGWAAAAILLNPAVFFVSAVWGQVDAVLALLVVGSFLLLGTGPATFRREAGGVALLAVAIGTKPQAVFVLPVVVLLLVWRHVRPLLGEDRRILAGPTAGIARMAGLLAVGAVAGLVLLAPFGMGPVDAVRFYARATRTYSVTSVFAFNTWGTIGFWRPDAGKDAVRFLGAPVVYWGLALFAAGALFVLMRTWRALREGQDEGRVLVFGSVAVSLVAFALLTRIHERYLFLPVALLAAFVGARWLRRAFVVVSALYLINVFFPYVYYLRYVKRPAPDLGGAFDTFYGSVGGLQLRVLSAITAVTCLLVAFRGWRALAARVDAGAGVEEVATAVAPVDEPPVERPSRWTLTLHPVGRRGATLALAAFALAFAVRVFALGHPPGMYFDEVYHARTGGEYLVHKEVYEWTHPPLAKELIALSLKGLSNFGVHGTGDLPSGVGPRTITGYKHGVAWAAPRSGGGSLWLGTVGSSCSLRADGSQLRGDIAPDALGWGGEGVFLAGVGPNGPTLARIEGRREAWRAPLPERATQVVSTGDRAYVITRAGQLVSVSPEGETDRVAIGAAAVAAAPRDNEVWASFPTQERVAMWDATGKRQATVEVTGEPRAIVAPEGTDRVYVASTNQLVVIDTETEARTGELAGGADLLATTPETGVVWAADGRSLRAIEPRGQSVLARVPLDARPSALIGEPSKHTLLAVEGDRVQCASGRPQFAWRFGSAVFGAAMVALVLLISLRLFGNRRAAMLAALFLAVCGLAFTLSRIAMNDSYATAFMLGAWFCVLSALYRWGRADPGPHGGPVARSRVATMGWLAASGVLAGLSVASKWVGLYALVAIGVVLLWDGLNRSDGIFELAGGRVRSLALLAVLFGVLPLGLYVLSYIPYFTLGHSFVEFLEMQRNMYNYHANLNASHPFGSPMYGWPFGYRAVFLYLGTSGLDRAEIWTVPNIVVFWGGLIAMGAAVIRARAVRSAALAFVVWAALMQYLPWVSVRRVTFLYHYLPVVPWLAIAIGWWLVVGLRDSSYRRAVAIGVPIAAVAFFGALLPMYYGWTMPVWYLDGVRDALPWVIP